MLLKELQIELTNDCQAKCLMCSHRNMKRSVKHMDLSLLKKAVDEATELSQDPYFVGICGVGEPLLHPEFEEAMKIVSKLPRFAVGTNGQALDEKRRKCLIDAKFDDLTLSLDAISPEIHSKMRPGLSFTTVLDNTLSLFRELRQGKRFWRNIYIQMILTKVNEHERVPFTDYWLKKTEGMEGVVVFIKPMYKWPGLSNPYYPGPKVATDTYPRILWGPLNEDTSFRNTCALFDNWAMIQSDGSYQPCCMNVDDDFKIGNIKDNTILELYNSPKMEEYRIKFREKRYDEIPFCNQCV